MFWRLTFGTALLSVSFLVAGCDRGNDKEAVALRAELETARVKIQDLQRQVDDLKRDRPVLAKAANGPRLIVVRGVQPTWTYPIHEGANYMGRADEKAVDVDLEPQEPENQIWSSRQHAVITRAGKNMTIEDLNSSNGTYVNRTRVPPGERRAIKNDDVVQIGNVHLKVIE